MSSTGLLTAVEVGKYDTHGHQRWRDQ
ncbi:hypothetical protein [Vibrio aestuarianus]